MYYVSARLGLRLALVDRIVTPLWPPTGVAVVALTTFGFGVWPAIAVAAFAVNVSLADTALVAAVIAIGNTAAPVIAVALLKRLGFDTALERLRDAVMLVLVALASMTISASVGTAAVGASSSIKIADTWWVWWAGDAMGVLAVAPTLWVLLAYRSWRMTWQEALEAAALFGTLGALLVVLPHTDILFPLLPVIGWIAWRFQQRGAAPALLLTSIAIVLAAAHHRGVFEGKSVLQRMALLQGFNALAALTSMVFAAAVIDRRKILAELYQREHRIAETLQRSLMPALPTFPAIALAARYLPASDDSRIAGDWYDVIPLAGDKLGLVIADVAGHGIAAAAAMAQLRVGVRAYARAGSGPSATLRAVNEMAMDLHPGTLTTLLYGEYDPEQQHVRFANAGHPPPVLATRDGTARLLDVQPAVPLGIGPLDECEEAVHTLREGETLVFFTDGLIERRGLSLEVGLETLRSLAASGAAADDLDEMCDTIVSGIDARQTDDDVALLLFRPMSLVDATIRLSRPATPVAVADVRRLLRRWLEANGATDDEVFDIVLAVTEAQTNVVRHAYRQPEGFVEIDARIDDGEVTIIVRDHGTWRQAFADLGTEDGGRGLALIKAVMQLEVQRDAPGTELRLRRRLSEPQRPQARETDASLRR
jgi:integral membrane sensor domain MASE1/anti-sigma regulatory factor (Ser/Thr protein kinase)